MAKKILNGLDLGAQRIVNMADPSSATDAVTKQYVDNLLLGLRWKAPVRVATTANGALATVYENGDTIDGVVLATGDRILLKNQTTQTENGIYTVNATGAPTRATDADSTAELHGAAVLVSSGTVNADTSYIQTTDNPTVGSSNLVWVQFGGGTAYTADGQGIEVSAAQFSLELDGTSLTKSATGLKWSAANAVTGNNGLVASGDTIAVNPGTGLALSGDTVAIDTATVVRKFAANVGDGSSTAITVTHNLGTRDITVEVYTNANPWDTVFCDVARSNANTNDVILTFATAPATNAYRVVVHG